MNMDLSFAIIAWNSGRYLERCLASIDRALAKTNWLFRLGDPTARISALRSWRSTGAGRRSARTGDATTCSITP